MRNITSKLPSNAGSDFNRWLVFDSRGITIGTVEKFRDNRSTVNPYKAFKLDGTLVGFVYKASALVRLGYTNDQIVEMTLHTKGVAPTHLGDLQTAADLLGK